MVVNTRKFQLMFFGMKTNRRLRLNIAGKKINPPDYVKLLGIEIDNNLMFRKHAETLCCKINKKITAFYRLNNCISTKQSKAIYNAVTISKFNYCPLI